MKPHLKGVSLHPKKKLIVTCPQKNAEKNCICLLFDMLSRDPAAITLRVCRVYIEEGLYEVKVGLEVNLRGLVGGLLILGKSQS